MQEFSTQVYQTAQDSKLLVTIPCHFRPSRLIHFAEVIRTLAEFPVKSLTVMILTNTNHNHELDILRSLVAPYNIKNHYFTIKTAQDLYSPHDLCWAHRTILKEYFCVQQSEYTHFIYHEDDTRFSYQNFCYFLHGRECLRSLGLLPSFVRVEFNQEKSRYYSTDQQQQMSFHNRPSIDNGQAIFVPVDSVYNAIYILDHELAYEFISSRSFDMEKSREISYWGTLERATLGLSAENIPAGYLSRYVVLVNKGNRSPTSASWIYHLPNNYTDNKNPDNPFGKIAIDALFHTDAVCLES